MNKEKKTELTKDKILKAAIEEFGSNGYAATSLNSICNTGISKGLLYHNFENKDAIYLACITHAFVQIKNYLFEQDGSTSIHCYMDARFHFFEENPHLARIFFEAILQPPVHLTNQIKELQRDFDAANREMFQNILEKISLRMGVTNLDAMDYFLFMQTMFHSYFCSLISYSAPFSDVMAAHEKKLSKLLDFMLYGIAQKEDSK